MADGKEKPWVTGPKELLKHADWHIQSSTAFDHRIAFISVDNAVELIIRTFLSLPKRARGSNSIKRNRLESAIGFPEILNLLEENADDRIKGIELADIEWFHRIRNVLYHEGNGITVNVDQLKAYRAVAQILFENLFDIKCSTIELPTTGPTEVFLRNWGELEYRLKTAAMVHIRKPHHRPPEALVGLLVDKGVVDKKFQQSFKELRVLRNNVAHGSALSGLDAGYVIQSLQKLVAALPPGNNTVEP